MPRILQIDYRSPFVGLVKAWGAALGLRIPVQELDGAFPQPVEHDGLAAGGMGGFFEPDYTPVRVAVREGGMVLDFRMSLPDLRYAPYGLPSDIFMWPEKFPNFLKS